MFNPFSYQGTTATIDGQPASMNGHSRIPEFVTNGVATTPTTLGYGHTYGYPASIPTINGTTVVNPMTGIPVMPTGTPAGIPGITNPFINNPFMNPISGYPTNLVGQPIVNTPWGIPGTYPMIPNIYNTIPATTFGIPAVQPFFGAGLVINPITGTIQPAISAVINPITGQVMPMPAYNPLNTIGTPLVNPMITNAIQNPFVNNAIGVNPFVNSAIGVNPFVAGLNPINTIGGLNTTACACPTGIESISAAMVNPTYFSHLISRMAGVNPIISQIAAGTTAMNTLAGVNPIVAQLSALTHNPLAALNNAWTTGINNVIGGMANPMVNPLVNPIINSIAWTGLNNTIAGVNTPWNTYGINPINTLGHINPWMGGFNQNWMTATNPLATIGHNALGLANSIGGLGYGYQGIHNTIAPFVGGQMNTIGAWPTRCI